ncbi:acetyl-CoA acetyltransferase [Clostridia bacterium]|nr:acetyl-CoA acetyltransferase [Clostridia bacterium]
MSKSMEDAVIVAYGRSAVARSGKGALRNTHPIEYAAEVLSAVLNKIPQLPVDEIEDVIIGCAKPELSQRYNIARLIAIRAGLPYSVPGQTVNRFCASGLQSISTAANMIMTGQSSAMVAGGVESMTAIPYMGIGDAVFKDTWLDEHEPGVYMGMGLTAELVAEKYGVSREQMEEFSVLSQQKAARAQENGILAKDIIPVTAVDDEGNTFVFEKDESVRANTTLESLAGLKAPFKENGRVTAGTSSSTNDGVGIVVLTSAETAREKGLKPLAKFLAFSVVGTDPKYMGIGPMEAISKVMKLTGLTVDDMDVVELNEAFAAQAIPCIKETGLDPEKVNINGGAIALGHPLGATGAILVGKALTQLELQKDKYALVSMCIGGGMGAAAILERLSDK